MKRMGQRGEIVSQTREVCSKSCCKIEWIHLERSQRRTRKAEGFFKSLLVVGRRTPTSTIVCRPEFLVVRPSIYLRIIPSNHRTSDSIRWTETAALVTRKQDKRGDVLPRRKILAPGMNRGNTRRGSKSKTRQKHEAQRRHLLQLYNIIKVVY